MRDQGAENILSPVQGLSSDRASALGPGGPRVTQVTLARRD